jgi:acetylornithine deacetylase
MEVLPLLSELVSIDSVNPTLVLGGAGEREMAAAIANWGRDAGLEVAVHEATPGRPSVVLRAPGTGGGRTLLLCGHTDVVGVEGMDDPFRPRLDRDRLHGRGSYDMKGGLAAALVACARATDLGLAGDVVVAAVADEEHASLGVQEILEHVRADAAIVTEPTEGAVAIAHKGFVWAEIVVEGKAAHGSRPHLGVDAIAHAGPILSRIAELDARYETTTHPLLGRASVHASVIRGGAEMSSYPDRCEIGLEFRTLPDQSVDEDLAWVAGDASTTVTLVRAPFETDPEHELVLATGATPVGMPFWADSAFIAAAGIPTILYGPSGEGAHATEEWVSVSSCETLAADLVRIAQLFCG